ncbi:MAG: pre-toxin TG domain-containing protein [Bacillota bacterium]
MLQSKYVYQLKGQAEQQTKKYLSFKDEQGKFREQLKRQEELENRPWYEKTWDGIKTFTGELTGYYDYIRASEGVDPVTGETLTAGQRVAAGAMAAAGFIPVVGWAGRIVKGGGAIYKTAKGMHAADQALDVYRSANTFSNLEKAEMGIYGLVSANGFSEYLTGKDMFGNALTEEQQQNSLYQALGLLAVGGGAYYVNKLQADNAFYQVPKTFPKGQSRIEYLRNKYGKLTPEELHNRINIRGIHDDAIRFGSKKTWTEFQEYSKGTNLNIEEIKNSYKKLIKEQSAWPENYVPEEITIKTGERFHMALSPGQPATSPGSFATFDDIIDVGYVRNDLAVKYEWKPNIGNVVTYEVVKELPVYSGPVGPQIDLGIDKLLQGGGTQINFNVPRNKIMDYIKVASEKEVK